MRTPRYDVAWVDHVEDIPASAWAQFVSAPLESDWWYRALERSGLDRYALPAQLLGLFARMQDFQLRCAADPDRTGYRHRAYRPPGERIAPSGRSGARRRRMFG